MVRQATLTAVSASISTPVWPEVFTRAVTRRPGSSGSGVISIGMKRAGETLSYRRDGNDVEITLNDDSLAYIRMRPAAP